MDFDKISPEVLPRKGDRGGTGVKIFRGRATMVGRSKENAEVNMHCWN